MDRDDTDRRPPRRSPPRSGGPRPGAKPWQRDQRARPAPAAPVNGARGTEDGVLFGIHPIAAALTNPRRAVRRLLVTENAERRLAAEIAASGLAPERASPRDLDRILGADAVHQGAMAEVDPLPDVALQDLAAAAAMHGPIVVLDQVTDPHNVGAILRSAAVFGAAGLVMTRRHSAPVNGTLAKSASGALELVPIALVQNLATALADLAKAGVTVLGLDGAAETIIDHAVLTGPVALVLGAEGKGLRELTRERCSALVRIEAAGPLASLNVSNAAAISLHLAAMRRREAAAAG